MGPVAYQGIYHGVMIRQPGVEIKVFGSHYYIVTVSHAANGIDIFAHRRHHNGGHPGEVDGRAAGPSDVGMRDPAPQRPEGFRSYAPRRDFSVTAEVLIDGIADIENGEKERYGGIEKLEALFQILDLLVAEIKQGGNGLLMNISNNVVYGSASCRSEIGCRRIGQVQLEQEFS